MPPTGEEFRQMLCKVLGEIRKNKEGDIVVPGPAVTKRKKTSYGSVTQLQMVVSPKLGW